MGFRYYTLQNGIPNEIDKDTLKCPLGEIVIFQDECSKLMLDFSNPITVGLSLSKEDKYAFLYSFVEKYGSQKKYDFFPSDAHHIMQFYVQIAQQLTSQLQQAFHSSQIYALAAIGSCDFVVISSDISSEKLEQQVEQAWKYLFPLANQLYSANMGQEDELTQQVREQAKECNYWACTYNPRSYRFQQWYRQINQNALNSLEEEQAYLFLLLSLKKKELHISQSRWLSGAGEFFPDLPTLKPEFDSTEDLFYQYMSIFLDNTKITSVYSSWTWMYYFYFRAVRNQLFPDDERSPQNEDAIWRKLNFEGVYPIITDYEESSQKKIYSGNSFFASPFGNIDYLCIPSDDATDFWNRFPSYLHEFYHYIPSSHRNERNKKILELSCLYLFEPLIDPLIAEGCNQINHYISRIVSGFIEYCNFNFISLSETTKQIDQSQKIPDNLEALYPNLDEQVKFFDSRYIYALFPEAWGKVDFDGFITHMQTPNDIFPQSVVNAVKASVTQLSLKASEFPKIFRSFCRLMKELRSDMAMCEILEWTHEKYISYILKDEWLCETSEEETVPSVKLRINLVIHKLASENSVFDLDEFKRFIDQQPAADEKKRSNLKNYLEWYHKHFIKNGKSIFSNILFDLLDEWQEEYRDDVSRSKLLQQAKSMYELRQSLQTPQELLAFQIENCLYFKDYYHFNPD